MDNGSRVATGYILAEKITPSEKKTSTDQVESNVTPLTTEDVYKIFSDRSYMYRYNSILIDIEFSLLTFYPKITNSISTPYYINY